MLTSHFSCESREIREMQEQMGDLQARIAGVLGLQRTTSRTSITSFAGSINTKKAYKRFCKNLFQTGVTSEMITQKEGEILNMLNQPQDTASSSSSAQLLTVSCFLSPECFIRIY